MELILDGKPYSQKLEGTNLQELVNQLSNQALGEDRMIQELLINGQPYEESKMGPAEQLVRESIRRLEISTISGREVALHFLSTADHFLVSISESVLKVAELFRVSDQREASEHYLRCLDSLQLFLQVLQLSRQRLELDFDRALSGGASAEESLSQFSDLMQEILTAQEGEDWVLLADVLQYDLVPELAKWRKIMPLLREQVLS